MCVCVCVCVCVCAHLTSSLNGTGEMDGSSSHMAGTIMARTNATSVSTSRPIGPYTDVTETHRGPPLSAPFSFGFCLLSTSDDLLQ